MVAGVTLKQKTASWLADHVTQLLWLVLGTALLFVSVLLPLQLENRLQLDLPPALPIDHVSAMGTPWLGHLHSLFLVGIDNQVSHLFNATEMQVLNALQQLLRLGAIALILGVFLLCVTDFSRYWRPILLVAVCLILMQTTQLFFLLDSGITSPVLNIASLFLIGFLIVWARPYLQRRDLTNKPSLIAYASQTGSAKQLATQLHLSVQQQADLCCLSTLTPKHLSQYHSVCFIVSTQGKGNPPDSALSFLHALQQTSPTNRLPGFSILALGDRYYADFCAFGHQLEQALIAKGLQRFAPLVEVDKVDLTTVNTWWDNISRFLGHAFEPVKNSYGAFNVLQNNRLNPSQTHRLVHHLRLAKPGVDYRPGDVLAVKPRIQPAVLRLRLAQQGWATDTEVMYQGKSTLLLDVLQHLDWTNQVADSPQQLIDQLNPIHERLYSIASCERGHLDLLVRQHIRADGSTGNGSGYLCRLAVGDQVDAYVRHHPRFHLPGDVPLIMIGAGTGLAPFIGFLTQKQQWQSKANHWLFFGEQHAQYDAYFKKELAAFQQAQILTHLDCVWSRDSGDYVQDRLHQHRLAVYEWVVKKGAHVFVCGSQSGFGESVLHVLEDILPDENRQKQLHTDLY